MRESRTMAKMNRRRINTSPQPDENYGHDMEVRYSEVADSDDTFDQSPLHTVLEREAPVVGVVTPVELVATIPVPIATLPLEFDSAGTLQVDQLTPVRILNEDKRRGQISIAATAALRIARSQAEVSNTRTSFRLIAAYGVVRFKFTDELWIRGDTTTATATWVTESWTD